MIAMSPGARRLTRTLVLRSTLAAPTRPGGTSALPRLTCANIRAPGLMDGNLIEPHPGIPPERRLGIWDITACYGEAVTAQPVPAQAPAPIRLTSLSHGAGCACKLPLSALDELMASLGPGVFGGAAAGDLLVGAAEADDAAVLRLDDERALVLTTDFFTPIVDDPGDWGRIAAANALSDVYAMGGRPLFAVNLAAWPGDGLDIALLGQVLQGGARVAAEAGCVIAGGHTIDDPVP